MRALTLAAIDAGKPLATLYRRLESLGARPKHLRHLKSLPQDIVAGRVLNATIADESCPVAVANVQRVFSEGEAEVVVWEFLSVPNPGEVVSEEVGDLCSSPAMRVHVCLDQTQVSRIGGVFFWKCYTGSPPFSTGNDHLLERVYLPVQLAADGDGVFFEERIVSRLASIGFLAPGERVVSIKDLGGWDDLEHLTAAIDVEVTTGETTSTRTLVATALVPTPPVKPETITMAVDSRRAFLIRLGILTSVLLAADGVVYERLVPFPLLRHLRQRRSPVLDSVIVQAASISAVVDSGCLEIADHELAQTDLERASDYFEIDSAGGADSQLTPSLLNVLRTDGTAVYWSDLYRNLAVYGRKGRSASLNELLNELDATKREMAHQTYLEVKQQCERGAWLSTKLW